MKPLELDDGRIINVELSNRARTRISISILSANKVRLSFPETTSQEQAWYFLQKKIDWLMLNLPKNYQEPSENNSLLKEVFFLGNKLPVVFLSSADCFVQLHNQQINIFGTKCDKTGRNILANYLIDRANILLPKQVSALAKKYNVMPSNIKLSNAMKRWGSCNSHGVIHVNWRLIHAPQSVIDYVISHELAHLIHLNHSAAFWAQVSIWQPNWRKDRLWLKQNANSMFLL